LCLTSELRSTWSLASGKQFWAFFIGLRTVDSAKPQAVSSGIVDTTIIPAKMGGFNSSANVAYIQKHLKTCLSVGGSD
jgi:hypothetical protein